MASLEAQDNAATLLLQTGQVSIQDGGYLKPLFTGNSVRQQQVIVTGPDSFAKFQLSDGSTFEVYANSRVIFRPPGGITNLLNLWIGRVKVFIDHSRGPNFKDVTTPTAVISVRGTVFDVVVEDSAGTTLVTLDEGLVGVRNLTSFGPEVSLHPGQSIRVFMNQPLLGKQVDPSPVFRRVLEAAREAAYRVASGRQNGGGLPGAGAGSSSGGPQADKSGKNGGSTGTGGSTSPTGTPTAPPPPPGGGG